LGRPPQIRITKNDRKEYARLAKNSKAKIRRTAKNYGVDLSKEVALPPLESFNTRKEFNEWKERQSSFTNPNNIRYKFKKNEHNVTFTVFEQRQGEKLFKEAKRVQEKERKKLEQRPVIVNGKVVGNKAQQSLIMKHPQNPRVGNLEPFNINNFRTRMGIENRLEQLRKRSDNEYFNKRLEKMKESWLYSLSESFHNMSDDIFERVKLMSAEDFYEFYDMFESVMAFELFYNEGEFSNVNDGILEKIRHYLDQYENDQMNPLFKLRNKKKG
jgi:hypothetical protein